MSHAMDGATDPNTALHTGPRGRRRDCHLNATEKTLAVLLLVLAAPSWA
jgi:hypothetical protein